MHTYLPYRLILHDLMIVKISRPIIVQQEGRLFIGSASFVINCLIVCGPE